MLCIWNLDLVCVLHVCEFMRVGCFMNSNASSSSSARKENERVCGIKGVGRITVGFREKRLASYVVAAAAAF